MTDLASITGLEPEQEEALSEYEMPEPPEVTVVPEVVVPAPAPVEKPKRHRRTKAEMDAARMTAVTVDMGEDIGATAEQVAALNCETPEDEIGYRPANFRDPSGKQLAYIDARYVMDVLDREVGPHNWTNAFESLADGSVRCTITVTMKGHRYVSKTDVGIPSTIEPQKGSHSDAFKRAAVHFGIARDLYDERMAEAPVAVPVPTPSVTSGATAPSPATVVSSPALGIVPEPAPVSVAPAQPQEAVAWVCPIHGTSRIQPGGVSRRTGKAYSAFWVCTERNCDQTGGNA